MPPVSRKYSFQKTTTEEEIYDLPDAAMRIDKLVSMNGYVIEDFRPPFIGERYVTIDPVEQISISCFNCSDYNPRYILAKKKKYRIKEGREQPRCLSMMDVGSFIIEHRATNDYNLEDVFVPVTSKELLDAHSERKYYIFETY